MKWTVVAMLLAVALVAFAGTEASPQTLKVYDEGKALYDAKDFTGALAKFDECARLEPQNARWPYNRGLALKKLGRADEAREALLSARALDPDYKRKEIDQKLSELPSASSPSTGAGPPGAEERGWIDEHFGLFFGLLFGGIVLLVGSILGLAFWFFRGHDAAMQKHSEDLDRRIALSEAEQAVQAEALKRVGVQAAEHARRLTRLEHGLSLGEDPDLRAHVDRAALNLKAARAGIKRLRDERGQVSEVEAALARGAESLAAAEARLKALRGAAAEGARGERVGCFFCARPLPTPESRKPVTLRLGGQTTPALACAVCARNVQAGQSPKALTVGGRHWSQVPDFDPYVHAHAPYPNAEETPPWKLSGLEAFAGLAGGAALAGALLLDLDAAKASSVSSIAAQAAAFSAREKKKSHDWRDNS